MNGDAAAAPEAAAQGSLIEDANAGSHTPAQYVAPAQAASQAPAPAQVVAPPPPGPAPSPEPAPVVEAFKLPLGELQAIAEGAGLQWVNSDADKIAAAQAAIAAEPAPAPLGREPRRGRRG